jgi:uncharacterized protein
VIALDASALVKRYVAEEGSEEVIELMAADPQWCAAALCVVEVQVTLCHLEFEATAQQELTEALRADWDRFLVVPVDELCLSRAAEIGCDCRVRSLDAIHLAAAERLPGPLAFVTFDDRQAGAARTLGFEQLGC